jgi:hypothetical protein
VFRRLCYRRLRAWGFGGFRRGTGTGEEEEEEEEEKGEKIQKFHLDLHQVPEKIRNDINIVPKKGKEF